LVLSPLLAQTATSGAQGRSFALAITNPRAVKLAAEEIRRQHGGRVALSTFMGVNPWLRTLLMQADLHVVVVPLLATRFVAASFANLSLHQHC
jgi:hypothetical protein